MLDTVGYLAIWSSFEGYEVLGFAKTLTKARQYVREHQPSDVMPNLITIYAVEAGRAYNPETHFVQWNAEAWEAGVGDKQYTLVDSTIRPAEPRHTDQPG